MDLLAPQAEPSIARSLLVELAREFTPLLSIVLVRRVGKHDCNAKLSSSRLWTEDDSLRLAFRIERCPRFREQFGSVRIVPSSGRHICAIWTVIPMPQLVLHV